MTTKLDYGDLPMLQIVFEGGEPRLGLLGRGCWGHPMMLGVIDKGVASDWLEGLLAVYSDYVGTK